MNRFPFLFLLTCFRLIALLSLSCNLAGNVSTDFAQDSPAVTVVVVTATSPTVDNPTGQPNTAVPLPTNPPQDPTATSGPQCTVQQSLNLRNGPGTAYNPPIGALEAGTQLVPIGYDPQGVPGGTWVQVQGPDGRTGWVSAGADFVQCNLDLTSLQHVEVGPPPPPPPPKTKNSDPDGTFPENLAFKADFNTQYLVRMYAHDTNVGDEDGDGIKEVTFTVRNKDREVVYEHSEQTAGYCIFGGGEPNCNPWVFEDFQYKWTAGGKPVEEGTYELRVQVTLENGVEGEEGNWGYQVEINLEK